MDFSLTQDQEALKESVRDFLRKESTSEKVRAVAFGESGFDRSLWESAVGLGWTSLVVPEEFGGIGLGWVEAAIVAEQIGMHLFPSPYYSSMFATAAILAAGDDEQKKVNLSRVLEGAIATVALWEDRSFHASSINMKVRRSNGGFVLDGTKLFVTDGEVADLVVVAAAAGDAVPASDDPSGRVALFVVESPNPGLSVESLPVVDKTRRMSALKFDGVEVPESAYLNAVAPSSLGPLQARPVDVMRDRACLYIAGEQTGIAARCLEMSLEYAKQRNQFGKPIGSYQAVSHKLADMFVWVEHARSLLYHAAWCADHDPAMAPTAAWEAKVIATQAAERATADGIQIHGGIGFTWEHDLHMYFKRARANSVLVDENRLLLDVLSKHRHG